MCSAPPPSHTLLVPCAQWLDDQAVYLGISHPLWRSHRVLFLLHTDDTWPGDENGLRHFAVLSVDLIWDDRLRLRDPAFGASSVELVIYDSKRMDYASGAQLDDAAIKERWAPQIDVVERLLGHPEVAKFSVAKVEEQHAEKNSCGVHAIL